MYARDFGEDVSFVLMRFYIRETLTPKPSQIWQFSNLEDSSSCVILFYVLWLHLRLGHKWIVF